MLRRFLLNSRLSIAALVALIAMTGTMMMLSCSKDGPVQAPEATWNFTVDVLDGNSGAPLANASIQYIDKINNQQVDTTFFTNDAGRAKIEGLSAGTQSFSISYTGSDSVIYTSVVVKETSVSDSTGLSKLADQAKTVKLFPLTGSIGGKVFSQINDMAAKKPASGITVSISYDNKELTDVSDVAKSVKTDSTGSFSFSGLPVATGLIVKFSSATISGVDFSASDNTPTLVSKAKVSIGTVIMTPINAANFKLLGALPAIVAPNDSIILTFSDPVDSLSYAKLEGLKGAQSVAIIASVSGAKLTLKPAISLVDSNSYKLKVYAFGKAGGSQVDSAVITVIGGGIIDVVWSSTSNVFDANHRVIDGLALSAAMKLTFRTAITNANASVTLNGLPVLVDVSTYGTDLTIAPKGLWEAGTYTVKVSANLNDGKASTFEFQIATAGALGFVSSNVYNPQNSGAINGLGIKDTIVVTANKKVASCQATLTQSGTSIPLTLKLSSDSLTFKIKSTDDLRKATSYAINVTVFTKDGESKSFSTTFTTASSDFYPVADNIRFDNDPAKPVLNFPPMGTIVIKMSSTVKSVTAQLMTTGNSGVVVPANVSASTDTIKITPVGNLDETKTYKLTISAESNAGTAYNEVFVNAFAIQPNRVYVLSSNVMNTNGVGLTNIPVTLQPYYVLSATPVASSIFFKLFVSGTAVDARDTVIGDTIRIIPVKNLDPAAVCSVEVKGKTTQNATIEFATTGSAAFTTRAAIFVVATNMLDAQGNPATGLLPSTELWVKFSRPLSTDLTKQQLGGGLGASDVAYVFGAASNNATIRVSNDTLFAKFMPNALPAYGASISLKSILVLFDDASALTTVDLSATIKSKAVPSVLATNGIKDNVVVDTFNVMDEVWIKSSLSFLSVDLVKHVASGDVGAANLVVSNVRTHGDTIFFKPSVALGYGTEYEVAFNVTLSADTSKYTGNELKLRWKTKAPLCLDSANDMNTGKTAYRLFSVTGDTLMIYFSKTIDTTKTFAVAGFAPRVNYLWGTTKKRVRIVPIDTLTAEAYVPNPDYTPVIGSGITITATTTDGENWTGITANKAAFNNLRPGLNVRTPQGIEVLNSNMILSTSGLPYVNTDNSKLSTLRANSLVIKNFVMGVTDTLKINFNRAVDSLAVATIPGMVQFTRVAGAVVKNVSISYANAHMTMLIKPIDTLLSNEDYAVTLTNVQALGLAPGGTNAKVTYSGAGNTGSLTFTTVTKAVATQAAVLHADTAKNNLPVAGKKLAYSGSIANAYAGGINNLDVPAANTIKLMWYPIRFRSAADSVSHYQLSVKGADNSWHDLQTLVAANHFDFSNPTTDSLQSYILNLNGVVKDFNNVDVGSLLRASALSSGNNAASIFNNGTTVYVKIRPVVHAAATVTWDGSEKAGTWSDVINFSDNVAPCDTDFVAKVGTTGNILVKANGGVGIVVTPCATDRSGLSTAGDYVFVFSFPEDMDTTTKPVLTTYYAGSATAPASGITTNASKSFWSNRNTYNLTVNLPALVDWSSGTGTLLPYYAISVAGMKDISGQVIQSWGSVGNAANGTSIATAIVPATYSVGTVNMKGLTAY